MNQDTCMKVAVYAVIAIVVILVVRYYLNQEGFADEHKHHSHHHGAHHSAHHVTHHGAHHGAHHGHHNAHKQKGVKARFCKVILDPAVVATGTGDACLQVGQLVVKNAKGDNVALNKNVTYPSAWPGSVPQSAVDGTLSSRPFPNIYHQGPPCGVDGQYYMVDFGQDEQVEQIVYYNRQDCCGNRAKYLIVQLLDDKQNVVSQQPITSDGEFVVLNF